jgi:hypothetical protein
MTASEAYGAVTEAAWQKHLASDRVNPELVAAAYAEPRLRRLFPWVGMWELHFSRCTEGRWTWDIPYIQPLAQHLGGRFLVAGPSRSEVVGPARTVEEAVAMVVERLPPGCGPAFVGTPAELEEMEKKGRTT